jgi:hypothetical protein
MDGLAGDERNETGYGRTAVYSSSLFPSFPFSPIYFPYQLLSLSLSVDYVRGERRAKHKGVDGVDIHREREREGQRPFYFYFYFFLLSLSLALRARAERSNGRADWKLSRRS